MKLIWLTCLVIAASPKALAQAPANTLRLEPGAAVFDIDQRISASFTLVQHPAGMWSTGRGGACLLADVSASLGVTHCAVQDDCLEYLQAFLKSLPADVSADGAHGYCAQPAGDTEPKRCWVRPGAQADYCVVSPAEPLPLGQPVRLPRAPAPGVPAFPLADGQPVRWMVNTCLNGFDFSQPEANRDRLGCKGEHSQSLEARTGNATLALPQGQESGTK
jgi:hypothetical protein